MRRWMRRTVTTTIHTRKQLLAQLGTIPAGLPDGARSDGSRHCTQERRDTAAERCAGCAHRARGPLIDEQATPNALTVLATLREIDPNSPLLHDPRLPGAFAQQTRAALAAGNPDLLPRS